MNLITLTVNSPTVVGELIEDAVDINPTIVGEMNFNIGRIITENQNKYVTTFVLLYYFLCQQSGKLFYCHSGNKSRNRLEQQVS